MGVNSVVVVLGFLIVQEISAQRLVEVMQDMTVREGESVILPCRFSSKPVDCVWTRGGSVIYPRYFEGTYDLAGNMEQGVCSLKIAKASYTEDNNMWFCQVPASSNSPSIQSPPAKLTVIKFAGVDIRLVGGIGGAAAGLLLILFLIIFCSYRKRALCFSEKEHLEEEGGETDVENAAVNNENITKDKSIMADDTQNGTLDGKEYANKEKPKEIVYADLEITRNSPKTKGGSPMTKGDSRPQTQTPTEYARIQFLNR